MGIYRRLLQYLKPHLGRLGIAVFSMLGVAIFTALYSAIPYIVINGLINKDRVIVNNIPHAAFIKPFIFSSSWIPLVIIAVFLFRGLFEYISNYQMASIGIRAIRKIRDDLYRHLVYLSQDFFSRGRTGDYMSRILNDVGSIQAAITDVVVDLIKQPLVVLFNIPMVFFWGGKNAAYAVIVLPIVAVPITILGKNLRRNTKKMQERTADITAMISETLAGINIVKSYNQEENEISKFERINKSVFEFFMKTVRVTLIQKPLIEVMGAVGAAAAVWFSLKTLPADRFTAFVVSLFVFYEPLKKISKVNSTIQQSIASGVRIFEVMDAVPTIRDKENAVEMKGRIREIDFEKISFYYAPDKLILNSLDLKVKEGEIVAIVGSSGSGKTTLLNLLSRFYDPTDGRILINGKDLRDYALKSIRAKISLVTQETILFDGTVRENIAYGNPSASFEEIRAAADTAYADHFIETLPLKYDTPLGERGSKLSGGQRQRLAIARALVKDPEILIFDEATSHLDTESEREVQTALENAMKNRTVFVIAHRLSTIQRADRIIVMNEGRIVQEGTNDSLLRQGGIYKKLHDLQFNL